MKTMPQQTKEILLKERIAFSNPTIEVNNYLSKSVIDPRYINRISGGDEVLRTSAFTEVCNEIEAKLAAMDKAFLENNYSIIQKMAHELQTTAFVLGMFKLVGSQFQNIEKMSLSRFAISEIKIIYDPVKLICKQAAMEVKQLI